MQRQPFNTATQRYGVLLFLSLPASALKVVTLLSSSITTLCLLRQDEEGIAGEIPETALVKALFRRVRAELNKKCMRCGMAPST